MHQSQNKITCKVGAKNKHEGIWSDIEMIMHNLSIALYE